MKFKMIGSDTSQTRIDWVVGQLKELPKGAKILDAGAGERRFKPYCNHMHYVAQDFGKYEGGLASTGLQAESWDNEGLDIVSDIVSIPVDDSSFDYILCTEVLEHVPDAVSAIREFSRILKPGGVLLTTAPFCSLTHFAPYHFSGYNHYWWEHHLAKNGFEIETIQANGTWFSFVAQELSRSQTVGKTYGAPWLGLLTRVLSIPLIFLLSLMERFDQGSQEMLCFGYMIKSKKITDCDDGNKIIEKLINVQS